MSFANVAFLGRSVKTVTRRTQPVARLSIGAASVAVDWAQLTITVENARDRGWQIIAVGPELSSLGSKDYDIEGALPDGRSFVARARHEGTTRGRHLLVGRGTLSFLERREPVTA